MLSLSDAAGAGASSGWRPEELAAMLRHQMDAPVRLLLADLSAGAAEPSPACVPPEAQEVRVGELIRSPAPSAPLLEVLKRFGKRCLTDPTGALPREIAAVLYYASIAAAVARG